MKITLRADSIEVEGDVSAVGRDSRMRSRSGNRLIRGLMQKPLERKQMRSRRSAYCLTIIRDVSLEEQEVI